MELGLKIGQAKRQLASMSNVLDELYSDVMAVQKEKIKQIKKQIKETVEPNKVMERIVYRMAYLNRIKNKPLMEVNARLDELSRLLDWIEDSSLECYGN